jgi:hypothetical protein
MELAVVHTTIAQLPNIISKGSTNSNAMGPAYNAGSVAPTSVGQTYKQRIRGGGGGGVYHGPNSKGGDDGVRR